MLALFIGVFLLSAWVGAFDGTPIGDMLEQTIIAISGIQLSISTSDILYTPSRLAIDPTTYVWREGSIEPNSVSIKVGQGTVTVAPNETITWAAGSYGCEMYYWEKGVLNVGNADTPLELRLFAVPRCEHVDIKVFDTSYHDLTNGNYNMTVSPGQDVDLQFTFDVTEEFFAIRRPHICVDYSTADVNRIKIAGLKETNAPRRIVSSLDQCFDTGLDYYNYTEPMQRYSVTVDAVVGQYISIINWYVLDMDMWWKDGEMYFVHPITNANMGAGGPVQILGGEAQPQKTCDWNVTTWFG